MVGSGLNPFLALALSVGATWLIQRVGLLDSLPFGIGERLKEAPAGVEAILFAVILIFFTVILLLASKFWATRSNRAATSYARTILSTIPPTSAGTHQLVALRGAMRSVEAKHPASLVASRMTLLRERLASTDRAERSAELLAGRSSLDASEGARALTVERTLVWALPVLGFVGTAFAMARTVEGFSVALNASDAYDDLKEKLIETVIPDLSQAFDVTLIALTLTVVAFLCTALLERTLESLVAEADEAALSVLSKLPGPRGPDSLPDGDDKLNEALGRLTQTVAQATTGSGQTALALERLRQAVDLLTQVEGQPRRYTFTEERLGNGQRTPAGDDPEGPPGRPPADEERPGYGS